MSAAAMSPLSILADNLCSGALVIGESRPQWMRPDLSNTDLHVFVNGALAATPRETRGSDRLAASTSRSLRDQNLPLERLHSTTGRGRGCCSCQRDTRVEVRCGSIPVASVLV